MDLSRLEAAQPLVTYDNKVLPGVRVNASTPQNLFQIENNGGITSFSEANLLSTIVECMVTSLHSYDSEYTRCMTKGSEKAAQVFGRLSVAFPFFDRVPIIVPRYFTTTILTSYSLSELTRQIQLIAKYHLEGRTLYRFSTNCDRMRDMETRLSSDVRYGRVRKVIEFKCSFVGNFVPLSMFTAYIKKGKFIDIELIKNRCVRFYKETAVMRAKLRDVAKIAAFVLSFIAVIILYVWASSQRADTFANRYIAGYIDYVMNAGINARRSS